MKIAIDIGHSALTSAVSPYAVEHEVARAIAQRLLSLLNEEGRHEARIIDHPDWRSNTNELKQIVRDANNWGADLLISLHADFSSNEGARGAHVCYRSAKGQVLANYIAEAICPIMPGRADSTKKRMDLYVLRGTIAVAVLIELGFITNTDDVDMLKNKQDMLAQAILRGISHYMD